MSEHNKLRYLADITSGSLAALSITPIVNLVDSSVTSSQSGRLTVFNGLKTYCSFMVTRPIQYILQPTFGWSFIVYALTYSVNNLTETYCEIRKLNNFFPKLILVSSVNLIISLFKDAAFARFFGVKLPTKVPLRSYLCWITRDVVAITNAFIVPERIVKMINHHYSKHNKQAKYNVEHSVQMSIPLVNILMTTPVNLLGLDIYNFNQSKVINRAKRVFTNYPKVIPLTLCRMTSAYGIGGVSNLKLKKFTNSLISKK